MDRGGIRLSDEAIGRKVQELLTTAGVISADEARPADEAWELGRLALAFTRLDDPRVRNDILSLLESIEILQAGGRAPPRR